MKLLTAKEIKKILIGVSLSDGYIDIHNHRFDFYTKHEEYAKYIYNVVNQITGMYTVFKVKHDNRGHTGYRVWTRKHAYWKNLGKKIYNGRKELNSYIVSRIDAEALAHIWMCDGYLEHSKNRKTNKIQNIGWLCLEAFPKEELKILQTHLGKSFGIHTSIIKKPWGFGHRVRIGGENLQKFISLLYPYILNIFKHKTNLFYKKKESANMSLPSAEHFIKTYNEVDDIVRYSQK